MVWLIITVLAILIYIICNIIFIRFWVSSDLRTFFQNFCLETAIAFLLHVTLVFILYRVPLLLFFFVFVYVSTIFFMFSYVCILFVGKVMCNVLLEWNDNFFLRNENKYFVMLPTLHYVTHKNWDFIGCDLDRTNSE